MEKRYFESFYRSGKWATIGGLVGVATGKVIESLTGLAQKDSKVRRCFVAITAMVCALAAGGYSAAQGAKCRRYRKEREADGDLYAVQREADARLIRVKAEAGLFRRQNLDGRANDDDGINPENDGNEDEEQDRTTWLEKFKSKFTMPTLPPFLTQIMSGVPMGYEEPMLFHLLSMLGAMCFSKVRAKYSDGNTHAANLQVIVEGNWGAGKAKFEQMFKVLFERIINISRNKIDLLSDPSYTTPLIVQTTGIGTSMSKLVDILAGNQGCHMYIFNSEVRALYYDLKKGNGLNFDFLRKAFENGDVCRNNRSKDSKNGIFPIFLNYTLTGTPKDINTSFKKELEGGTLSRIAWTCIPEAGRYPGVLLLPEGKELDYVRDKIDEWAETYCYQRIPGEGDEAVGEVNVDLDYVCEALDGWNDRQYELYEEENNPARKDVRLRMATIAFHCAIVLHMLYDNPAPANWQKRKQVVDLTLFIADYCIERFLHKYGKEQNIQRKLNQEAEYVEDDTPQAEQNGNSSASLGSQKITDIGELKRLHDQKDESGQSMYGWKTLAKMSGMSPSTIRTKIMEYEASHEQK